jgi:hypothetical protein
MGEGGLFMYTALGPIHANMQDDMTSWAQQITNKTKWAIYMSEL